MRLPILFIDMDNVIVDFNSSPHIPLNEKHVFNHEALLREGFFMDLEPLPGAITAVKMLIASGEYDVHILTQPYALSSHSYKDKVDWINKWLPELRDKIHMTQNKLLMRGEVLIDDSIKWSDFQGEFYHFDPTNSVEEWNTILGELINESIYNYSF
jgi:5'(3')-deoxyribonucleotidase